MNMSHVIEVSGLRKVYRGSTRPAVNDLSFVVSEGEIFGLLGPNGAGKSTTLMMLCGLLSMDGGSIRVLDFDARLEGNEIRSRIGVATQEIALFPMLTARENLNYFGRMYGLSGPAVRVKINNFLDAFGLAEKADVRVAHFSGGMKRRLNLIAALLNGPRLLILDEPTSGVDVQSRSMILDYMRALKAKGVTIVYSSHLLEEAEKVCDQFAIIDEGRLLTSGTLQEMLANSDGCVSLEQLFLHLTGRRIRD